MITSLQHTEEQAYTFEQIAYCLAVLEVMLKNTSSANTVLCSRILLMGPVGQ